MLGVVVSCEDDASVAIGDALLELVEWEERTDEGRTDADGGGTYYRREDAELRAFDELHLELEDVATAFSDPDLVVFVSRHAGDTGPLLTAHFTGNAGEAEFGGEDGELAQAAPNAHRAVVEALSTYAPEGYDVGMECTHHGPSSVGVPSMFVEVGSARKQWEDPGAARAVARAVLDLRGVDPSRDRTIAGFGGGHYAPRFERIVRETDWTVGHVIADWGLDAMAALPDARRRDVIEQALERSDATLAVVDGNRPDVRDTVEGLGYRVESETWLRETTGVPLDLVARLESALATVNDGLRFGERARSWDGQEVGVYRPDPDLLSDLAAIDPAATVEVVNERSVAYETAENGNRVTGRIAIDPSDVEKLLSGILGVLRREFESVERKDGEIVATESAFDPELARDRGVPEGPAFGRLADGEPVEVDGTTVRPEAVHVERTRRYER